MLEWFKKLFLKKKAKRPLPNYFLANCVVRNRDSNGSFEIPSESRRKGLHFGWQAKLAFELIDENDQHSGRNNGYSEVMVSKAGNCAGERMWLEVIDVMPGPRYLGRLVNQPIVVNAEFDDRIDFGPEHICDIASPDGEIDDHYLEEKEIAEDDENMGFLPPTDTFLPPTEYNANED